MGRFKGYRRLSGLLALLGALILLVWLEAPIEVYSALGLLGASFMGAMGAEELRGMMVKAKE